MASTTGGDIGRPNEKRTREDVKEQNETEEMIRRKKGKFVVNEIEEKESVKDIDHSSKFPMLLSVGRTKEDVEWYNPINGSVRKMNWNLKDLGDIIGHNPFDHWITMLRGREIMITNGVDTIPLSPLPEDLKGEPRFGYTFGTSLSIVVCFSDTRFIVYWHHQSTRSWEKTEFVEPMHCPDGFVVYDGHLVWINTIDGTLHVLTDVQDMDRVDHQSFEVGRKDFKVTPPNREFTRFSAVTDIDQENIYFVCKEDNGEELDFFAYECSWESKYVGLNDLNIAGFTFFVAHDHSGVALALDKDRKNKIYYAGHQELDCGLINYSSSYKEGQRQVGRLKECYDVVNWMGRPVCKCHNLWFICNEESPILRNPRDV